MEELDKKISEIVRTTVKGFMESLMKGEIQAFLEERGGQRNGYYERDLGSRYGKINDLRVPRDRDNEFQTALFEPYQRNIGIDDLVVSMYSKGISTRKMAEILEELFHNKYSKSTISRITEITVPEISKWRSRPLEKRCTVHKLILPVIEPCRLQIIFPAEIRHRYGPAHAFKHYFQFLLRCVYPLCCHL